MLSDNIINIVIKYQNFDEITKINDGIKEVIRQLKHVNNNISEQLYMLMDNTDVNDSEGEIQLIKDSQTLRSYISNLKTIPYLSNEQEIEESGASSENIYNQNEYDNIIFVYIVSDNICPVCNVKILSHYINYFSNDKKEGIHWYKCPCCNKLFCIDREVVDFDFSTTNIRIRYNYYKKAIIKNLVFTDIIVLSTIAVCSHNKHKLRDVMAKIPVINDEGKFEFVKILVSYCEECNKYIMLKSDFKNIEGSIACKVIDQTIIRENKEYDDLEIQQRESILYQYGYNVKTKENLSDKQRHLILASVIESGILTREEVCSHLSILIERGSKIPKWNLATQKWIQDRHYVKKYNTSNLPETLFEKVILKYSCAKQIELDL